MKFNPYIVQEREYPLAVLQRIASHLRKSGKDIINLTVGDPKEKTYGPMKDRICEEVQKMVFSQYPKPSGETSYLRAVSRWAQNAYGVDYDPSTQIISCNGSKEAIFSIPLLFDWSTNKQIFIPSLSYPVYANAAGVMNIPVRYLPVSLETQFLPDLSALTPTDWSQCGIFWLNSPHNPTTAIASAAYLKELLDLADRYGFLVCSDECYNDLYYESRPTSCLSFVNHEHFLVFRSLSKRSHMTGFRVGALISPNTGLISHLRKMRAAMGVGTPTFIQNAATLAWDDIVHPQNNINDYRAKRDLIKPVLESTGFHVFGGNAGFYFWISHPDYPSSAQLSEWFLSHGILVTPGTAFGPDGEGYVRMIYCETEDIMNQVRHRIMAMSQLEAT